MTKGNNTPMPPARTRMRGQVQRKSLWWLLAVALLAIYFLIFRPREVTDGGVVPPAQEAQQEQPAREPAESLPTPEGEGLGANEAEAAAEDAQLRRDREFIARAFPVLSSWNMLAVKPLLSAATLQGSTDEQLTEVMRVLAERLGKLQSFEQPVPTATADSQQSTDRTGRLKHYEFHANYEKGLADVDLVLHQLPDTSSLYSFNINVP